MKQIHKIYRRKNRTIYATYEPKWENFQLPFIWCFMWAYKLVYLSTVPDNYTKRINVKQYIRGGNNSNQTQIGIVNNYVNNREEK